MQLISELTGKTIEEINEAKALVLAGDMRPLKELLFDSALLLHGAALAAVKMANQSQGFSSKHCESALRAIEGCKQIFLTLAEHSNADALGGFAATVFQKNLEQIMKYIARKGGSVKRYELLTSRVIKGVAIDYDKALAALIDSGYISAIKTGAKKEITYSITPAETPLIEVFDSDKGA